MMRLAILVAVLLGSLTPAWAQSTATLQGTVTDTSGGAVPAVAIHIKNLETGAERNLVTDEAGRFDAASLPVGRYEVRAEKPGFRSEVKTGISVVVGQREIADLVLQVGDVRQTVKVESAPTVVVVDGDGRVADVVESWDREGVNRVSSTLAGLLDAEPAIVSEPGDGLPGFKPG